MLNDQANIPGKSLNDFSDGKNSFLLELGRKGPRFVTRVDRRPGPVQASSSSYLFQTARTGRLDMVTTASDSGDEEDIRNALLATGARRSVGTSADCADDAPNVDVLDVEATIRVWRACVRRGWCFPGGAPNALANDSIAFQQDGEYSRMPKAAPNSAFLEGAQRKAPVPLERKK